jgi:hypothetical protein
MLRNWELGPSILWNIGLHRRVRVTGVSALPGPAGWSMIRWPCSAAPRLEVANRSRYSWNASADPDYLQNCRVEIGTRWPRPYAPSWELATRLRYSWNAGY